MPLADLRAITLRQWALAIVGGILLACVVLTTIWTVRHAAAHSVRGIAIRAGERILLERAPVLALDTVLRRIGVPIARRIAGRGVSRWLPVIGAAGVAGYAYYDTMRVADTTIDLFRSELVEIVDVVEESVSD